MAAEKEIKIPVFSVIKKGSILKHIFLNSPEPGTGGDGDDPNREAEPILIGRHPDCHIVLDHPSISRFHLEVRKKPAMQKLSVVDRSSIHGTWVSGTKIQPHVPCNLVDGDLLRLGSSTRAYRFQWVPVSRALEMEKPMEALLEEREETYQEEIPMPLHTNSDDTLTAKNPSVSESTNPSSIDEFYSLIQMESQSPAIKEFDKKENSSFSFLALEEPLSFSSARNGENGKVDDFSAVEVPPEREHPRPLGSEKWAMPSGLLPGRSKSISPLRIPLGRTKERAANTSFAKDTEIRIQKGDTEEQGERECSLSKVLFADNSEKEVEKAISSEKENSTSKISADQECKKSHAELQHSPSNAVTHSNTQEVFNSPSNEKQDVEIQREDNKKQGEREGSLSKVLFADNNEKEVEEAISSEKENSLPKVSADQECNKNHTELQNLPSDVVIHLNTQEEVFDSPSNKKQDVEFQKEDIKKQGEREGSLNKVLFSDNNEKEAEEAISSEKQNSSPKLSADQECKKNHTELQNSPSNAVIHLNTQEVFNSPSNEKQDVEIQKEDIKKLGEREGSLSKVHFADNNDREESISSEEEDSSPKISADQACKKSHTELQNSPSSVIVHLNAQEEVFNSDKENRTPQVSKESELKRLIPVSSVKNKEQDNYASDEEHVTLGISLDHNKMHPDLERSPSTAISSFNLTEGILRSDREMWTPESSRVQSRKKLIFENLMDNVLEDASALDKDNVSPQLSYEKVLRKSQRDLPGSSSIDISSLNMEENQFRYDKENRAPEVLGDLDLERPISKNNASNRRDKGTFTSDKENSTTKFCSGQKPKSNQDKQQPFITALNAEGVFPTDKENQTPEVPRALELKKPIFENCEMNTGEKLFPSDKENQTPDVSRSRRSRKPVFKSLAKIERELTRKRVERVPLQLLFDNNCHTDGQRTVDKRNNAIINSISANHHPVNSTTERMEDKGNGILNQPVDQILRKVEEKKKWNIVVDTSCFLDEESKRSLQLLEGLKGTHLIIPMMVIRELDCMKRRKSWFRKETKASAALQWIERCMVKSSSWIHVQSSSEMIPESTPPASPQSLPCEGNNSGAIHSGFTAFSTCGILMEILSPTAEDHILDTALLFKRIKTDGQLVLLSNDITLKIKAMAEGLPCRTPKEFLDSLVNPYSKRFLWMESSARGATWSSSDQMAYTENYYYQLPDIRKAVDGAKGLKLILLRNSRYAQNNLIK